MSPRSCSSISSGFDDTMTPAAIPCSVVERASGDGTMTITIEWDGPIGVDGPEWHQLHKLVQTADPGEITVVAEVLR